eukprot:880754-Prorocentrum_minimum.AAC.2
MRHRKCGYILMTDQSDARGPQHPLYRPRMKVYSTFLQARLRVEYLAGSDNLDVSTLGPPQGSYKVFVAEHTHWPGELPKKRHSYCPDVTPPLHTPMPFKTPPNSSHDNIEVMSADRTVGLGTEMRYSRIFWGRIELFSGGVA